MSSKVPKAAIALLVTAALVAAAAVLFAWGLLTEYGTTTGSWVTGSWDALRMGAVPMLAVVLLAAGAVATARDSSAVKSVAAGAVLVGLGGLVVGGAHAAATKYDRLSRSPSCDSTGFAPQIKQALRPVQQTARALPHPGPFAGGGSTGYDGCSDSLLNVTFEEAATHYRKVLTSRGWSVTGDEAHRLSAAKGKLVFRVSGGRDGMVVVHVGLDREAADRVLDEVDAFDDT